MTCMPGPLLRSPPCLARAATSDSRHLDRRPSDPRRPVPSPVSTSAASPRTTRPTSGHAATYNAFDLVQRVWLDTKRQVHYVQNVTDVDDPLLERAARDRRGLDRARRARDRAVPRGHDRAADAAARATTSAPSRRYRASCRSSSGCATPGAAYELDGDIYFSVDGRPALRRGLPPRRRGHAAAVRRARRRPGPARQEEPARPDALDGAPVPGEPSWDGGTLGRGRPGWHIECVAIALDHLGMGFDVQGGGSDLAFPHHEMGASHAQVLTGEHPFAQAYVHAGMVALDGEKMSKSKGNLVFVSTLRRDGRRPGGDPARAARPPLPLRLGVDGPGAPGRRGPAGPLAGRRVRGPTGRPADALVDEIRAALADDLDAPAALARRRPLGRSCRQAGGGRARRRSAGVAHARRRRAARRRAVERRGTGCTARRRATGPSGGRRLS